MPSRAEAAAAAVRALQPVDDPPGAAPAHQPAAAARALLNAVVGSPTAKRDHAAAGAAPALVAALARARRRGDRDAAAAAAAALGALACRCAPGARTAVEAGAPDALVRALFAADIATTVQAAARALHVLLEDPDAAPATRRAIMRADATDDHGNAGLHYEQDGTRADHRPPATPARIVALLADQNLRLAKVCAHILAAICVDARDADRLDRVGATRGLVALLRSSTHEHCTRAALTALVALTYDHRALAERLVTDGTLDHVLPLLRSRWPELRLLACTVMANTLCSTRKMPTPELAHAEAPPLQYELKEEENKQQRGWQQPTRRDPASDPDENGLPEAQARYLSAAVVELVHLFHGSGPNRVRVEAARVAAKLISTSVRLQQLACETGAVELLVDYFPNQSSCPSYSAGPTASLMVISRSGRGVATQPRMSPVGNRAAAPGRSIWHLANRTPDDMAFRPRQRPRLVSQSSGEPDAETRHPYPTDGPACELYKTGLSCLAALCSLWEPGREACITAGVLSTIVVALNHPADVAIVTAAVKCIRSLSRSVRILRRELVNADVVAPLRRLLNADSLDIRRQASACICNLILDFSPMKHALLSDGGIVALVALLRSEDAELRLNGLWALENATFNSDEAVKADVMNALGFERLAALCTHVCGQVSERALNLLRNLVFPSRSSSKEGQVNAVFQGMGESLVPVLTAALVAGSPAGVAENALYVVCNIASGTEAHKGLVMRSTLPEKILACLQHENERVRVAAVWCVINLCWSGSYNYATNSPDIAGALFPPRHHLFSQEAGRAGGTAMQAASHWERLELVTRNHSMSLPHGDQESPSEERQIAAVDDTGGSQMESADPVEPDFKGDSEGDVAMGPASPRNVDEPSVQSSSRDLRIDQLRAMGFESRLTSLLDDPAIEVAERARSALNFFVPGAFPDNSPAIANLVHSSGTSVAPEYSSSDEMDS